MDLTKAKRALSKDVVLKRIIKSTKLEYYSDNGDVYSALIKTIISQQLSVKAAASIYNRFVEHFGSEKPLPKVVLSCETPTLRSLGLSNQKANYVKNVAQFFKENKIDTFATLSDQEVMDHLISIKGVGEWTVQMILIFTLDREDVYPMKDLIIQKKTKELYQLQGERKELIAQMEEVAEKWRPYRSIASRYLWAAENSNG